MYAFIVNWNYKQDSMPLVITNANYYGGSWCDLEMSSVDMKYMDLKRKTTYLCYYETTGGSAANLLAQMLKKISKIQYNYCIANTPNEWRKEMQEYLTAPGEKDDNWYNFNIPKSQENAGLYISKLNTKHEIKPCFFAQEYQMTDDNDRPLYMAILMEKADNSTDKYRMYDYNIKFIGARQPLTEFVSQIPLCDAEELYQQKVQEYISTHQEYYKKVKEEILQYLSDQGLRKCFNDYSYTASNKILCRKGTDHSGSLHFDAVCGHRDPDGAICHRYNCLCYSRVHHHKHDGVEIHRLFVDAFGEGIANRVHSCQMSKKDSRLLPDVSNPEFIRAFNKFAMAEYGGATINCFDYNSEIKAKKIAMCRAAHQIQACASNMNTKQL